MKHRNNNIYRKVKNQLYLEGAFSFANITLLEGIFLIGLALLFGADNFQIGIIMALPLLANLIQLISPYFIDHSTTRKRISIISYIIGRGIWVLAILLSFRIMESSNAIWFFIIVIFISGIFNAIGNLALLTWLKEMIPTNKLADFFGARNIFATISGAVIYLIGAYIIDVSNVLETYGIIFTIALILGLIAILFLFKVPDKFKKKKPLHVKEFIKKLRKPYNNKNFRKLLIFSVLWGFAINFASPFFLVYMIDDLALGFIIVSIFSIVSSIGRIYGLNIWRKLGDKFGAKPLLISCATVTSIVPLMFLFINSENYFIIPLIYFVSAISFAGIDISTAQLVFKNSSKKDDTYYLSAFTSLTGIISSFGPIIAGFIATQISTISNYSNTNIADILEIMPPLKYIFLLSFIFRTSCLPLIANIKEPKSKDVRSLMKKIKNLRIMTLYANVYNFGSFASKIITIPQKELFNIEKQTGKALRNKLKMFFQF